MATNVLLAFAEEGSDTNDFEVESKTKKSFILL